MQLLSYGDRISITTLWELVGEERNGNVGRNKLPITLQTSLTTFVADGDDDTSTTVKALPQKRYYRQRAHCNPMSDHSLD